MVQNISNGLTGFGWENGHSGAAGHPDGQLGHDEMGTVFRKNGHPGAWCQVLRLKVGRHRARLLQCLSPGVVNNLPLARGLCHVDTVWCVFFMCVDMFQNQFNLVHRVFQQSSLGVTNKIQTNF